ncbi:hypothetical protein K2173_017077 [Erythroxylum novogranatense]|uniref:F-box domain-containing protein n=1 Tax=Erythroxylum novogranatense TaxID=1862640 RepID=A0AAV8U6V5_9ROSI|nr:hypothetical protein K2173_017077 [Erythroxylum novogranatense]
MSAFQVHEEKNQNSEIETQKMSTFSWAELPKDLLASIANCLNSDDFLRFRGVCKSWRSSVKLCKTPAFPPKLPFPISSDDPIHRNRRGFFSLEHSSFYLLEPLEPRPEAPYQALLIMVKAKKDGKLCLLNPFEQVRHIGFSPKTLPKDLNLLDYRVTEITRAYSIRFNNRSKFPAPRLVNYGADYWRYRQRQELCALNVNRVVLSSTSDVMVGIYNGGTMFYMKDRDRKWTLINEGRGFKYEDVAFFEGKWYGLERSGLVAVFSSSMDLVYTISSPVSDSVGRRYLIESFSDLFMVHANLDPPENDDESFRYFRRYDKESLTYVRTDGTTHQRLVFFVFKLNLKDKIWEEVQSLEDRSLFLGDNCRFSVTAKESAGCIGNHIYYEDHFDVLDMDYSMTGLEWREIRVFKKIGVCNFWDGVGRPLVCFPSLVDIFWPPPIWLRPSPTSESEMLEDDEETDKSVELRQWIVVSDF